MKELTAAQGLLRCGECDTIFDAMKALSTTLPEERHFSTDATSAQINTPSAHAAKTPAQTANTQTLNQPHGSISSHKLEKKSRRWLYFSIVILLSLILLAQLPFAACGWLADHPFIGQMTQGMCKAIGYQLNPLRDIEQIKMLSHNVYSHPNTPNVLIISTSIQNNADFEQPYPTLEVKFLNSASEVVALKRFIPDEYLGKELANSLMPTGTPREFSLNINDPGKDAVRFQFRFL